MMAESALDVKGQGGSIWALNHAMHTDSAITFRFESGITCAEPVMANR